MNRNMIPVFFVAAVALQACSANRGANGAGPERSPTPAGQEEKTVGSGQRDTGGIDARASKAPRVVLSPPGKDPVSVRVEVARTPGQRQRGLMFRKSLDRDAGMLFVFERPDRLAFWMRNTYIPLDMIFIEPGLTVLGIVENTEPLSDRLCSVPGVSRYVLEVNAGFSRRHGLTTGTSVRFEGIDGLPGVREK
jgi:uncharacterized membrane protein (UPF0127 family)